MTDGSGEVTTLSYATTAIDTPSVTTGSVSNSSFSATISGTDIFSGQAIEYLYGDSIQTLSVKTVSVPALGPWGLLVLACWLAASGRALARRS